jgi:hypothetical protein
MGLDMDLAMMVEAIQSKTMSKATMKKVPQKRRKFA